MRYEMMLPGQIRRAIEENWPVVLPLGVLEYHGEHMAVGMDTLVVIKVLERLEKEMNIVILPPFYYGAASYAVEPPEGNGSIQVNQQVLAPFAPHVGEELWARLGGQGSVMQAPWPAFDAAKLAVSEVKLVFQVNGKHRGDQLVPVGTPQDAAVALAKANPRVAPYLEGKAFKRVVFVPGKILNIVTE